MVSEAAGGRNRMGRTGTVLLTLLVVVAVATGTIAVVQVISGGSPCDYPNGDPDDALEIGNQRLAPGELLTGFVLRSEGGHAIEPPNVERTTVTNGSVYATRGDNIKFGDDSTYERLYLEMADAGGHLDAMQGQGATGVTVRDVTIQMRDHQGVTGAILFQTRTGGQGGDRDITFDLNCVRLIGTGPYGQDIRVDYNNGADVTGRITNVDMEGTIVVTNRGRGGQCRLEVDSSVLERLDAGDCTVIEI